MAPGRVVCSGYILFFDIYAYSFHLFVWYTLFLIILTSPVIIFMPPNAICQTLMSQLDLSRKLSLSTSEEIPPYSHYRIFPPFILCLCIATILHAPASHFLCFKLSNTFPAPPTCSAPKPLLLFGLEPIASTLTCLPSLSSL